jgi:hypothetical protein
LNEAAAGDMEAHPATLHLHAAEDRLQQRASFYVRIPAQSSR